MISSNYFDNDDFSPVDYDCEELAELEKTARTIDSEIRELERAAMVTRDVLRIEFVI